MELLAEQEAFADAIAIKVLDRMKEFVMPLYMGKQILDKVEALEAEIKARRPQQGQPPPPEGASVPWVTARKGTEAWTAEDKKNLWEYRKILDRGRAPYLGEKCSFEYRRECMVNFSEQAAAQLAGANHKNSVGIALSLAEAFDKPDPIDPALVPTITTQHLKTGQRILHLDYKEYSQKKKFGNPGRFYGNLVKCLEQLKDEVVKNGWKRVAISLMGAVHDSINWKFTQQKLKEIFKEVQVTFVVYTLASVSGGKGKGGAAAGGVPNAQPTQKATPTQMTNQAEVQSCSTSTTSLAHHQAASGSAGGGRPLQPPQNFTYNPPSKPQTMRYLSSNSSMNSQTNCPPPTLPLHASPPRANLGVFFDNLGRAAAVNQQELVQQELVRQELMRKELLQEQELKRTGVVGGGGPIPPPPLMTNSVPHWPVLPIQVGGHNLDSGTFVSHTSPPELPEKGTLPLLLEEQRMIRKSLDTLVQRLSPAPFSTTTTAVKSLTKAAQTPKDKYVSIRKNSKSKLVTSPARKAGV
jgi:hypothetical protein